MTFWVRWLEVFLLVTMVTGCNRSAAVHRAGDDEREPFYLKGQDHVRQLNYEEAINSFHKALELNPQSAAAHKELGILYEKHKGDPAAAIYHYRRYLKLMPESPLAKDIEDRVAGCQIDLVEEMKRTGAIDLRRKEVVELQAKLTQLEQQHAVLKHESDVLRQRLQTVNPALANIVPSPQPTPPAPAPQSPTSKAADKSAKQTAPTAAPVTSATAAKKHTVGASENPTSIARRYGIKAQDLIAANPGLDPKRLVIGQTLTIPRP